MFLTEGCDLPSCPCSVRLKDLDPVVVALQDGQPGAVAREIVALDLALHCFLDGGGLPCLPVLQVCLGLIEVAAYIVGRLAGGVNKQEVSHVVVAEDIIRGICRQCRSVGSHRVIHGNIMKCVEGVGHFGSG